MKMDEGLNNNIYGYIEENINSIKKRISESAVKSGRKADDIKIIAVTKTIDIQRIYEVVRVGLKDLGENRVQELTDKFPMLGGVPDWHLIGHLQTNKVKYIIDKVKMIHSLDRRELAEEMQKQAEKKGCIVDTLIQVNIAEEESKFGIKIEETTEFIKSISKMPNINIRGLMTIAPYVENPEEIRWVFRDMRKLYIDIIAENIDNISMDYLSMGMSNDFEVAIQEGSNMVRIGTAIFGKRN